MDSQAIAGVWSTVSPVPPVLSVSRGAQEKGNTGYFPQKMFGTLKLFFQRNKFFSFSFSKALLQKVP